MKKIYLILIALSVFTLQACAVEQWKEGEHYDIIAETASEEPQVLEFFSYWCPHCYQFEPLVASIKEKLPDNVKFQKVHVNFMGFTGPDVQDAATRALMVARAVKDEEKLNQAVFRYIHVQRAPVTGINDLKQIFVANGVDQATFDKLVDSFAVNSQFQQNNKIVDKYRKHLRGVPNFIVNGKYQAKFTKDMTAEDVVELIVWLAKLK